MCGQRVKNDGLTKREMECLRLLAVGKTVKEIATLLDLSAKTVEAHKYNLMQKLDLHRATEITIYAIQHNIITVPVSPDAE